MTIHAAPKPAPVTEAERRTQRIASLKKLEQSRRQPIAKRKLKAVCPRRSLKQRKPRKAVPRKNEERQQRVAVIRRQKHAAYRRSECYKAVEARAQGQCERIVAAIPREAFAFPTGEPFVEVRCPNRRSDGLRMHHHHLSYSRYGGKELPGDMQLLCEPCHRQVEAAKPHKNGRPF